VVDRARWLLLTHNGRVVLATVYIVGAVISTAVYTVTHGLGYGLGQVALFTFGFFWIRWCIQRRAEPSTA